MLEQDFKGGILNQPIDIQKDFTTMENQYFIASNVGKYNSEKGSGELLWKRHVRKLRMSFNDGRLPFESSPSWEFPPDYPQDYELPFKISFISDRTIRIRMQTKEGKAEPKDSIMLVKEPEEYKGWGIQEEKNYTLYQGEYGKVKVTYEPWNIEVQDKKGKTLIKTHNIEDTTCLLNCDPMPFSFVRKAKDNKRRIAASFSLAPGEKIYGCGESFTKLDKRGQKLILYTKDPHGVQTPNMYKPIPFYMSSRGYGMFYHTSAPLTLDLGHTNQQAAVAYLGDEDMDLFIFIGEPKEILEEYTEITGRSSMPPLWSFGLWMSRITYKSEEEVREVATKLRENRVPCDVIHIDTGWFDKEWRCDYQFSKERFPNAQKLLTDLKKDGFKISLWQYPYFTPKNVLYKEIVEKGYAIKDSEGLLPTEDAILDFSNPKAVEWYQSLISNLLEMGVSCIKTDFGEAAPVHGFYYSGKSGFYEHNLYPLRYNKAVSEVTQKVIGDSIVWARSAWAGSQRYPIQWGGDSDNTDSAMGTTLCGGLSLGLCGFTFWSHDIGGFVKSSPEELYKRWLPFGLLSSHSRCHGAPPKEPWMYSESFLDVFRTVTELRYQLMPYIYAQAKASSEKGYPMMRTLFFEFPEDPGAWNIEDQYMFGEDLLVAPLMEKEIDGRWVYLPNGNWVDYQNGKEYEGGRWFQIKAEDIPAIVMVREGAAIPHAKLAQSTDEIDFKNIDLQIYGKSKEEFTSLYCNPSDGILHKVIVKNRSSQYEVKSNLSNIEVKWNVISPFYNITLVK